MAYTFDVNAWEDFDGNRRRGTPSDIGATHGVRVHYHNPEDEEDQGMFWAYALMGAFKTWAEWWVYIGAMMERHGMELADE